MLQIKKVGNRCATNLFFYHFNLEHTQIPTATTTPKLKTQSFRRCISRLSCCCCRSVVEVALFVLVIFTTPPPFSIRSATTPAHSWSASVGSTGRCAANRQRLPLSAFGLSFFPRSLFAVGLFMASVLFASTSIIVVCSLCAVESVRASLRPIFLPHLQPKSSQIASRTTNQIANTEAFIFVCLSIIVGCI